MIKRFLIMAMAFSLIGCATTQGQSQLTQLQLRVGELEQQVEDRDMQIQNLNQDVRALSLEIDRLNKRVHDQTAVRVSIPQAKSSTGDDKDIVRVSASTEEVQRALAKSGHYQGAIDGKIGARTQKAIADFQKERGLNVDGIVGAKTWSELKEYLD